MNAVEVIATMRACLLQYDEGAIFATEAIYKVVAVYAESQEAIDKEHTDMMAEYGVVSDTLQEDYPSQHITGPDHDTRDKEGGECEHGYSQGCRACDPDR